MKFLVDAQLPQRLSQLFRNAGHDSIHTLDLPKKNNTPDTEILEWSMSQQRIVITKDNDFVNSFLVLRQPYKLLLVSTGNIHNQELEALFLKNLSQLIELFQECAFIEVNSRLLVIHE